MKGRCAIFVMPTLKHERQYMNGRINRVIILILTALTLIFFSCGTDSVDNAVNEENESASVDNAHRPKNEDGEPTISDEADIEPTRLPKRNWKKIAEFFGAKSQKTKTFKVKGKEWKVSWNVEEKGNDNGEFIIILHNKKDKNDTEIIAQQKGSGEDFAPFEGGQGEYYLEVQSTQPYSIEIHEYK